MVKPVGRGAVILFSGGVGAWELACEWEGVPVLAACEADPERREMLRAVFPHHEGPIYDDVRTLTADRIRSDLGVGDHWRPWLVAGSPPCQDASLAARDRRGLQGERTGLFAEHVRLVRDLRPDWMAAENVGGFTARDGGTVLDWLGADYRGWLHRMADEDVGAPHIARRFFILARRLAEAAEEPLRRRRQSRRPAPDPVAAADKVATREHERCRPVGAVVFLAAPPSPHLHRQHHVAVDYRPLAGGARAVGGGRRPCGGHWGADASEALRGCLLLADGLSGRMARRVQEAFGDSFPPQLAAAWIGAMKDAEAAA